MVEDASFSSRNQMRISSFIKIYSNLSKDGPNPWFYKEKVVPEQIWDEVKRSATRNSKFFLPLIY